MYTASILGAVAAVAGFTGFLIALVVGLIGLLVGRVLDGQLEWGDLVGRSRGR